MNPIIETEFKYASPKIYNSQRGSLHLICYAILTTSPGSSTLLRSTMDSQ